jgi:hypothetical protein
MLRNPNVLWRVAFGSPKRTQAGRSKVAARVRLLVEAQVEVRGRG